MTNALCVDCGNIKFGAFCKCDKCHAETTGNQFLDIIFSDHHYSVETLEQFAKAIKEIHAHCEDPVIQFWAFIHYISKNHLSVLRIDLEPKTKALTEEVLIQCHIPKIVLRNSSKKDTIDEIDWNSCKTEKIL